MVPLNTTTGRAPARGRRPQDAPRLSAVPTGPAPSPDKDAAAPPAGLPDALANAVLHAQAPPKAAPKAPAARTSEPAPQRTDQSTARVPAPAPERGQGAESTAPATTPTSTDTPTETSEETALVAVESPSAAEAERAIKWLGVTFRPPDVWRERQPSLREEWAFVMDGSHLPEEGLWRALARGYAAPAIGVITVLHFLIWVLRSPARHATVWAVVALIAVSAAFML